MFTAPEIEYHLRDSDAKAVFVFEGTAELPMARVTKEAFDKVDSCEHLIVMTADMMGASPIEGHKTLTQITFDKPEQFEMFPTRPDDTCAILYTSGTTGQPKGAELTHINLWSNIVTTYSIHMPVLDFTDQEQKTCLITLPLFHTTGQTVQMNTQLYGGNRVVLLPRFDAETDARRNDQRKGEFLGRRTDDVLGTAQIRR